MQARYDSEVNILRIHWSDDPIEESNEDQPGIILDYDSDGKVIGIQILNALKHIENVALIPV